MDPLIHRINPIFFLEDIQGRRTAEIIIQKIILLIGLTSKIIFRPSSPFLENLPFESRSILNINNIKFKNYKYF